MSASGPCREGHIDQSRAKILVGNRERPHEAKVGFLVFGPGPRGLHGGDNNTLYLDN